MVKWSIFMQSRSNLTEKEEVREMLKLIPSGFTICLEDLYEIFKQDGD